MSVNDRLGAIPVPTAEIAIKTPVRVATTANITLSGTQTIDGVAVVADDRVLVKDQTTATLNGIYEVSTGNWSRARDFNANSEVTQGMRVFVTAGTVNAGLDYYVSTANPITLDTTSLAFSTIGAFAASTITADSLSALTLRHSVTSPHALTMGASATGGYTGGGPGAEIRFNPTGTNTNNQLLIAAENSRLVLATTGGNSSPAFVLADTDVFGTPVPSGTGISNKAGFGFTGGSASGPLFINIVNNGAGTGTGQRSVTVRNYSFCDATFGCESGNEYFTARGGFTTSRTAVQAGDQLGAVISVFGYGATDYVTEPTARIIAYADENHTNTASGGRWAFQVSKAGTNTTFNVLVIQSRLNVGIGPWGTSGDDISGEGVIGIKNMTVAPSSAPTGAGWFYADSGRPRWRGPADTSNGWIVTQDLSASPLNNHLAIWSGDGAIKTTSLLVSAVATSSSKLSFFAATTSAELAGVISDETGSGALVFANTPNLVTPALGAATATSINGLTITSSTGTLTITNGKTLSVSNTLTFTGTDSSSVAFGAGGTVAYTANKLSAFAATTSAELAGVISDETGSSSGVLVFNNGPTLISPVITTKITTASTDNLNLTTGGQSGAGLIVGHTASTTGGIAITPGSGTPSTTVQITASGAADNIAVNLSSKGTGAFQFITGGTGELAFKTNGGTQQLSVQHTASADTYVIITGSNGGNPSIRASGHNLLLGSGSALATGAIAGYVMIPSCAGTPTGAPDGAAAGAIPMHYDTTAHKIWFYSGSWRGVAVT